MYIYIYTNIRMYIIIAIKITMYLCLIPIPKHIPHRFLAVREALHCFEDVVPLVGMGKEDHGLQSG